jgi:low affinity Fe/Cu permease
MSDHHSGHPLHRAFERAATQISHITGLPTTFALAVSVIAIWAVSGPLFHFSDTWQLIINTGTTIVTFLMVFLIQSSQNRDGAAIQAKLDELIRSAAKAKDAYIGIEDLSEEELQDLRAMCRRAKALDAATNADVADANRTTKNPT